jgi:hypothetical protein
VKRVRFFFDFNMTVMICRESCSWISRAKSGNLKFKPYACRERQGISDNSWGDDDFAPEETAGLKNGFVSNATMRPY